MVLLVLVGVSCATLKRQSQVEELEIHTLRIEYANAFLVKKGATAFLIDAGHPHNAEELDQMIRDTGTDPSTLKAIVVTHGHADHAGGVSHFYQKYGVPVIAGRGDADLFVQGKMGELCPTDRIARKRYEKSVASTFPPVEVKTWIEPDSAPIELEPLVGIPGQIIAIPGHTEGSIWVRMGEVGFMGDLFRGEIAGKDATVHFFMCDLEDNHGDIAEVLENHPEIQTFYTGHFGPVTRKRVVKFIDRWDPTDE